MQTYSLPEIVYTISVISFACRISESKTKDSHRSVFRVINTPRYIRIYLIDSLLMQFHLNEYRLLYLVLVAVNSSPMAMGYKLRHRVRVRVRFALELSLLETTVSAVYLRLL